MKLYKLSFSTAIFLLCASSSSSFIHGGLLGGDCPDGYYKDDLGLCLPYDKTLGENLNPAKPLRTAADIVTAIANGRTEDVFEALGEYLINSPNCVACDTVATNLLPNIPKDQLHRVVGRGFIVFSATGDPSLVVADFANNTIVSFENRSAPVLTPLPPPKDRSKKFYTVQVDCMIRKGANVSGYSVNPISASGPSGSGELPYIDIYEGDELSITSPLCSEYNDPLSETQAISSAVVSYERIDVFSGPPNSFRWAISGNVK